jgi:geranylgeranyl diphosphate synthase type II
LVAQAKAVLEPWKAKAQPLLALADYVASRDR